MKLRLYFHDILSAIYDQTLLERLQKLQFSCYQGCRGPIGTAAADVGQDDSRDATPSAAEASTGGQANRSGQHAKIELAIVGPLFLINFRHLHLIVNGSTLDFRLISVEVEKI